MVSSRYRRFRAEHPMLGAACALRWAKATAPLDGWERSRDGYRRQLSEGLVAQLRVDVESIYPLQDDGLGDYADSVSRDYDYDCDGNYPRPATDLPLGLPYTAFRYTGVVQGDGGYFVPAGIQDQYAMYRRCGQSKSVAWDLTRSWVEQTISSFFGSPLTYATVIVSVHLDHIELAHASIGTSYVDDYDGRDDALLCAHEYGLLDDALALARQRIETIQTIDAEEMAA